MQELIDTVAAKTGVSKDQAKQGIEVVLDYLEKKLPKPIAGQLRGALTGNAEVVGQVLDKATDLTKGLGGMFGGKG
jgi:hypothetical protein